MKFKGNELIDCIEKRKPLSAIETIDVIAKEWFDRINGNSFFSARITINYKLQNEKVFILPFQYGYSDQYKYEALKMICNNTFLISAGSLWRTCENYGIVLRTTKHRNCKKREVLDFVS